MHIPELLKSDIVALHRLPSKPDAVPGIILRFATQRTPDALIDKKTHTKRCRWTGVPPREHDDPLQVTLEDDKGMGQRPAIPVCLAQKQEGVCQKSERRSTSAGSG